MLPSSTVLKHDRNKQEIIFFPSPGAHYSHGGVWRGDANLCAPGGRTSMIRWIFGGTVVAVTCALAVLAGSAAMAAEGLVVLKLSFFTSDRELAFQAAIKPFLDAVNTEGQDLVRIDAYTSGAMGRTFAQQVDVVAQQTADIAFVNPALTPARFPEQAVMQLPGVFNSVREATLVYTRLVRMGAFRDLSPFVVIGAI